MQNEVSKYDDDGNLLLTHRTDEEIRAQAQDIAGDPYFISMDLTTPVERHPGGLTAIVCAWVTVETMDFASESVPSEG